MLHVLARHVLNEPLRDEVIDGIGSSLAEVLGRVGDNKARETLQSRLSFLEHRAGAIDQILGKINPSQVPIRESSRDRKQCVAVSTSEIQNVAFLSKLISDRINFQLAGVV